MWFRFMGMAASVFDRLIHISADEEEREREQDVGHVFKDIASLPERPR